MSDDSASGTGAPEGSTAEGGKPDIEFAIASLNRLDDDKLNEITDQVLSSEKGASALRSMMRSVMRSALRSTVRSVARSPQR